MPEEPETRELKPGEKFELMDCRIVHHGKNIFSVDRRQEPTAKAGGLVNRKPAS